MNTPSSRKGVITFDESAKEDILFIFGVIIGDNGYLKYNRQPNNLVLVDERPMHISEFAGIISKDGKPIFLRNDIVSLIEISDKLNGDLSE